MTVNEMSLARDNRRDGSNDLVQINLSFVDMVMLYLLDCYSMTGYVLKKKLSSQFGLRTSYGTLYPKLRSFEKLGILKVATSPGAISSRSLGVTYQLTPEGRRMLSDGLNTFDGFLRKIRLGQAVP